MQVMLSRGITLATAICYFGAIFMLETRSKNAISLAVKMSFDEPRIFIILMTSQHFMRRHANVRHHTAKMPHFFIAEPMHDFRRPRAD